MDLHGDRVGQRPDPGAAFRIGRHQWIIRARLVEVCHDRERLGQPQVVDFEHRNQALRVAREMRRRTLFPLEQVDRACLVGDIFVVERDADPVAGR